MKNYERHLTYTYLNAISGEYEDEDEEKGSDQNNLLHSFEKFGHDLRHGRNESEETERAKTAENHH